MNGRCETDPFDQAIDVCGSCYGEFCRNCLVTTKRRKRPMCKDCAIVASGVRTGAKPTIRGDKKTADERRSALQSAPEQESFQYFDEAPLVADPPAIDHPEVETEEADPVPAEPGQVPVAAAAPPGRGSCSTRKTSKTPARSTSSCT